MKKLILGSLVIAIACISTFRVEKQKYEYYTFEGVFGTSDYCEAIKEARCLINGRMAIVSQYSEAN